MTIDAAALGARANLGLIQRAWQCVETGMYLSVPFMGTREGGNEVEWAASI